MKKVYWFATVVFLGIVTVAICLAGQESGVRKKIAPTPVLKVAVLIPLTGPGASLGEYVKNGITLAEGAIKEQLNGKLIVEVELLDSKSQPREAVSALQAMIARARPDVVISALSSVSNAVKPIVEQEGLLTVATTTALADLLDGSKHILRVYPTSLNFVQPVAEYMAGRFKRVAIVYIHDDFGESNYRVFRTLMEGKGVAVVSAESYELLGADARSLVMKTVAAKPEAVYIVGYGPSYTNLFKQFKEQAQGVSIVADIALANPAVMGALGKDADGIVFDGTDTELTAPTTEAAAAFRKKYQERFGKEPFMVAGFAYDALMMLARASIIEGEFKAPTRKAVVSLSPYNGIMGRISLDEKGENNIPLRLMIRRNANNILYTVK